jgi:VWFA-related protein
VIGEVMLKSGDRRSAIGDAIGGILRRSQIARSSISVAVISLIGLSLLAQGQPPAPNPAPPGEQSSTQKPQQPPVFRTGADLVRVDVAVLDRRGLPVPTLTANDFELQEDGVTQEIRAFQYVRADGQPVAGDDVELPIRSRSHAASEAAKDDVRVFLIFWDEYHIGQLASAVRARQYLMQFVRTAFGPRDLVAFMDPLTPLEAIVFTRDRLELAERVRKLQGRLGVYVPTRSAIEDAHMERGGDIERLRSEVTVSALKAAAVHLGGLRDGRKSIILISEGLRGMMRDSMQSLMTDLIRAANDNNTAFFTVDPRGFGPQRISMLLEGLSVDTGGQFFRTNDLEHAFRQVVTQASAFYLLGYSSQERPADGRFHKIKVRVKQSGLEVRARAGYWAPSAAEIERTRTKAAESELPPDVQQALAGLTSSNARRMADVWIGHHVATDGRPEVTMTWLPRAAASAAAQDKVTQLSAVAMSGQTRVFDGPVEAAGVSFAAPPGALKITMTMQNGEGEELDREVRTIDVPDPAATSLAISTPAVIRMQNIREVKAFSSDPNALPFAGREFARSDRLQIRFSVEGSARGDAAVAARIVSQWGKDLAPLTVTRSKPDVSQYEIDLSLSSVARGDFLIAISATAGADAVRTFVPLRILR